MPFKTEKQLFDTVYASSFLYKLVDFTTYTTYVCVEPKGLFGIPDIVLVNKNDSFQSVSISRSFAFELKLSNWKRAIIQAYRYKAFANHSYVVIDENHVGPAISHIDDFRRANIGLLSVDDQGNMRNHFQPNSDEPYSPELETKLYSITQQTGLIIQ